MSPKKKILVIGSLVGGSVLLAGLVAGASAYDMRRGGGWYGDHGFNRMDGRGFDGRYGPMRVGHHRGGSRMMMMDTNRDGIISKEEATKQPDERFDRFDLDKNGEVTAEEAINSIVKRFEGEVRRKVREFDENGDGKVTKQEFAAPALERFARFDRNGDGKITKDEMPRYMQRSWRGKRGWFGGSDVPPPAGPAMDKAPADPEDGGAQ